MAAPTNRTCPKSRGKRHVQWFHLVSVLFPVLLFLCGATTIGQENLQEAPREARVWLEFNHHVGGLAVLALAGLTWLELLGIGPARMVKFAWPSCLILIGLYNIVLSDRFSWPLGSSGLVESLSNPQILQHKLLAILVLTLGLIELLRRLERAPNRAWLYLFYGVAALTGVILLIHDVGTTPHAHPRELTGSHVLMGLLAFLALVLKVLIDHRMSIGRLAFLYPLSLIGLGMQLLMFQEPIHHMR